MQESPMQLTLGFDVPETLHKGELLRTCSICGTPFIYHDFGNKEEYINACCRKHWIQLFSQCFKGMGYLFMKNLCEINGITTAELEEAGVGIES